MCDRKTSSNPLPVVLTCTLAMLAPVGCGGSGAGATTGATMPLTTAGIGEPRAARDVSGQYFGTVVDNFLGAGQVAAELAQYQNSAGGIMTFTYGIHRADNASELFGERRAVDRQWQLFDFCD